MSLEYIEEVSIEVAAIFFKSHQKHEYYTNNSDYVLNLKSTNKNPLLKIKSILYKSEAYIIILYLKLY